MNKQKELWEKLAKKNSLYYINSDKGRKITEEEFWESGREDFHTYIANDPIIQSYLLWSGTTILDIGCGIGRMVKYMARYFKKVIGIDISGEMIRQGREKLKRLDNVELIETDGETIPLPDDSVDFVFSYLVFQHMKSREMVEKNFKETYRVLKPKGLFKVRLRADKLKSLKPWWSGVNYTEYEARILSTETGFFINKTEKVKDYGLWLWLIKP